VPFTPLPTYEEDVVTHSAAWAGAARSEQEKVIASRVAILERARFTGVVYGVLHTSSSAQISSDESGKIRFLSEFPIILTRITPTSNWGITLDCRRF
jgi:hypothetical protein